MDLRQTLASLATSVVFGVAAGHAQEVDEPPLPAGEWIFQCEEEDNFSSCEVLYIADIIVEEQQLPIFRFSLSKTDDGKDYAVLYFPYMVDLYLGMAPTLFVDGHKLDSVPWMNCTVDGCWAHKPMPSKNVRAMKRGREAVMRVQLLDGRHFDISFTLLGITSALDKLGAAK